MKKLTKKLIGSMVSVLVLMPTLGMANEYQAVEDKLKKTFTNFTATYIQEAPVKGIYEIHTTDNIIYFSPESEIMFFGRIFNKDGIDLTQKSLAQATKKRMEDAGSSLQPLFDKALVLGEGGDIKLTIFTNPDCPYCQKADEWLKQVETAKGIKIEKHMIFLSTPHFSDSDSKIRHIICSDDKGATYNNIQKIPKEIRRNCDEADDILKAHNDLVSFFGVNGTPSFLLDNGEIIGGLDRKRLSDVIDELTKKMEISNNE